MTAQKQWLFDSKWTQDFTRVRQEFITEFLQNVRRQYVLKSSLDLGCGVGYFSEHLSKLSFEVVAVDGREENAAEARRRHPNIDFICRNVEDSSLPGLGKFDFVACIGLLYHLENPFHAVRNIFLMTGTVALIETMCSPHFDPMMDLLDEENVEDQSLNCVAFYPTESCLIKMLYRAGFPFVYRFRELPNDELFRSTLWRKQERTFIAASRVPLSVSNAVLATEPTRKAGTDKDPWATIFSRLGNRLCGRYFQFGVVASKRLRPLLRAVGLSPK